MEEQNFDVVILMNIALSITSLFWMYYSFFILFFFITDSVSIKQGDTKTELPPPMVSLFLMHVHILQ